MKDTGIGTPSIAVSAARSARGSSRGRNSPRSKSSAKKTSKHSDAHTWHGTIDDDPVSTTNLEMMADCVRPPTSVKVEMKQKLPPKKKSLEINTAKVLSLNDTTQTSSPYASTRHFSSETYDASGEQTLTTAVSSLDGVTTVNKDESRQPSPIRDQAPPKQQTKTKQRHARHPPQHPLRGGGAKSNSKALAIRALHSLTLSGSNADDSSCVESSPSYRSAEHHALKSSSTAASRRTAASSASAPDFKLSTERLEVLVMQLRETKDEKEAATIVLEFALRIKNHELVIQGADLSIINAMKRFGNNNKIQTRGCKALAEMATKGLPNVESIVDKGGCDKILIAMEKHRAEEDLQKEACRAIECITRNNNRGKQAFGDNAKLATTAILHAMKDHPKAARLQRMACRALASIASECPDCSRSIVHRGGLDWIRRTLKNHDDNTEVIECAFDILINITSSVHDAALDEEVAMTVSMERVLAMMLLFRKNEKMQSQGMALLCILCKTSQRNRAKIATLYGLEVITKSLETCSLNKEVQRHGTTLIQHLSQSEGNAVAAGLMSEGGMELLLNVVRRHGSDPVVVQQIFLIIAKMARPFSDTIRKEGGIELILSGMKRHEEDINVQEAACMALWKLASKTENANVINGNGGVSLINAALARFATDEAISEVACEALATLSHDKQMILAQETLKARAAKQHPVEKKPRSYWNCGVSCF
ncbi:expressed unknown protein [Seminavis robusta]|uniref:LRRK2 ARM repeat domain-containing protein n=1 Tax=Seminavis robusta TaxID=568900 RepID=A0A9N8HAJ8_9STRA|nr:expressed unknown protein [Seminavis robusta]|eukprot:Sro244_g097230.1 n/a (709) ;mRNA; r:57592-59718